MSCLWGSLFDNHAVLDCSGQLVNWLRFGGPKINKRGKLSNRRQQVKSRIQPLITITGLSTLNWKLASQRKEEKRERSTMLSITRSYPPNSTEESVSRIVTAEDYLFLNRKNLIQAIKREESLDSIRQDVCEPVYLWLSVHFAGDSNPLHH